MYNYTYNNYNRYKKLQFSTCSKVNIILVGILKVLWMWALCRFFLVLSPHDGLSFIRVQVYGKVKTAHLSGLPGGKQRNPHRIPQEQTIVVSCTFTKIMVQVL